MNQNRPERLPHLEFERQAAATPDRVACESERTSLTYSELNARANRLARVLRDRLGVGTGDSVGVCTDQEPDLLIALLAVLKCGAVYVPMDAAHPVERIRYMAEKAKADKVLVSGTEVVAPFAEAGVDQHGLAALEQAGAGLDAGNLTGAPPAASRMYIIFTSGSTGRPKAVESSHAALLNNLDWFTGQSGLREDDCWLQTINPCFDPSLYVLLPLVMGARVAFLGGKRRIDGDTIVEALRPHGGTHLMVVATLLKVVAAHPGFAGCDRLRQVITGGEIVRPSVVDQVRQVHPAVGVQNIYGPTETTIITSAWNYHQDWRDRNPAAQSLPIGPAQPGTEYFLRDPDGRFHHLAPGLEGELCTAGAALAIGYVDDVDATEAAFPRVALPGHETPQRVYLTGDLCGVDDAGELYVLGRIDDQVKVNGQRVELGEIESVLDSVPGVREATAFIAGDRLLAAVVRAGDADGLAERTVLAKVAQHLPAAWVPRRILFLTEIPRQLVSGKADRGQLAALAAEPARPVLAHVPATEDVPEVVAATLAGLIGVAAAEVPVDEPFADLGLDSVGVLKMALELGRRFDISVRAEELFEFYTVTLLAEMIETRTAAVAR
ncbi:amino acid adenylation domain-containing protein [Crossiella equi]|uniref:Amino acid adenylation domain-containing protein n=1 Tax=Crossiella equi TaxID=130796 RepID=A0ABS5A993_9PSEU|nr:non-ribosomal peptide synthetase [Crossiella equi]MBP2473141.1 amino acid adenylation domain-containing protein [Crossiella equi]